MKKLLFVFLLFVSFVSFAQNDTTKYFISRDYGWMYNRLYPKLALVLPTDTISNKLGLAQKGSSIYVGNGTYWSALNLNSSYLKISDTASMLSKYLRSNLGVKYSDTSLMLQNYAKISLVNTKLNISDTANKWINTITRTPGKDSIIFFVGANRYAIKDSVGNGGGSSIDTTSLSNRINLKVNISDTSSMLSHYFNSTNYGLSKSGQTISIDTVTLSNKYLRISDTSNKWVNNITRTLGKDSIIFYIGSKSYAIKDSVGTNPPASGYYLSISDSTTQDNPTANTPRAVKFNVTDLANGFSLNTQSAVFIGTINNGGAGAGTTLNVTSLTSGRIKIGMVLTGGSITTGTFISAFISGSGGVGTYEVSVSQLKTSATYTGTMTSQIVCANTGIYNLQFSSQMDKSDAGVDYVNFWLRKNGTDISASSGVISLQGNSPAYMMAAWNYVIQLVAGDTIELYWGSADINMSIKAETSQSSPFAHPAVQSTIFTITQQAGILAGTGVTAINSLTGSAQTMVTGTDSTDFKIVSIGTTHKFNIPNASASGVTRGLISNTQYNTFNSKIGATDTANMLSPYLRKIDTAFLSSRINFKVNISDTGSMLSPYLKKIDTATLSNRINLKVNISDTSSMLTNYQKSSFAVKYSDTASMLTNYLRSSIAAATYTKQQDTIPMFVFGAGSGASGDTSAFTTSAIYGSFYNDFSDTIVLTSFRIGLQGTSPSINTTIYFNDSLAVTAGATKIVNAGTTATNIYTGTNVTSLDNTKIAPGNWIWVQTGTLTTKPTYFTLTLFGYKSRR